MLYIEEIIAIEKKVFDTSNILKNLYSEENTINETIKLQMQSLNEQYVKINEDIQKLRNYPKTNQLEIAEYEIAPPVAPAPPEEEISFSVIGRAVKAWGTAKLHPDDVEKQNAYARQQEEKAKAQREALEKYNQELENYKKALELYEKNKEDWKKEQYQKAVNTWKSIIAERERSRRKTSDESFGGFCDETFLFCITWKAVSSSVIADPFADSIGIDFHLFCGACGRFSGLYYHFGSLFPKLFCVLRIITWHSFLLWISMHMISCPVSHFFTALHDNRAGKYYENIVMQDF